MSTLEPNFTAAIASGNAAKIAGMRFRDAAQQHLTATALTVRGRTAEINGTYAKALNKFFGDLRLRDIHIGHIRAYQAVRSTNAENRWKRTASPTAVNHELSLLQRVLRNANCWASMADLYKPLPQVDSGRRKVMSDIEERRLLATAASRPEWRLAYSVAMLTLTTTRAGTELRHLRLQDVIVDGAEPRIIIDGAKAKNGHRGGAVRLATEAGLEAARFCLERAKACGSCRTEHFLFPFGLRGHRWDPTRPATGAWLRRSFKDMVEAAAVPWLTPHCLRHQAITKLAEAKVPDEGIRQIAGHVSPAMLRVYSHCRLEHQATHLKALELAPAKPSNRPAGVPAKPSAARPIAPPARLRRVLWTRRRRAA